MKKKQGAFTLIEVLVALAVFGVVSSLAYSALTRALDLKQRVDGERMFWSRLSLAFVRVGDDFRNVRERSIRGESGDEIAAFAAPALARSAGANRVEFTRAGIAGDSAASAPQRIAYEFSDGTLWRLAWPALDRAPGAQPSRSALLRDIESFQLRFRGATGMTEEWPSSALRETLPRGVEMAITIAGRGTFNRVFVVHG